MKILIVQDHLRSGGTERQSILLARGFLCAGHRCTLLTFRPGGALAGDTAPVPHQALQTPDRGLDWWAPGLTRHARAADPDIVLCMGRLANAYAGRLQRALPTAAVVGTLRTGKPLSWLFRRSLHQVRWIVANSRAAADRVVTRHPALRDRLSVIHNALVFPPQEQAVAGREAARQAQGAGRDTVVLLCVAMMRREKNHRALIELAARLPADRDWQLWLAGDGPERPACTALIHRLGLDTRVRLLGWTADPTPLYHGADLAVLTSQRESLSNFLIEAQAHGLPAVAYDALGVAETMRPGESGFVVPMDDADAFVTRLTSLLTDPDQRRVMSRVAREHARSAFSPARQLEAYLDLFSTLAPPRAHDQ